MELLHSIKQWIDPLFLAFPDGPPRPGHLQVGKGQKPLRTWDSKGQRNNTLSAFIGVRLVLADPGPPWNPCPAGRAAQMACGTALQAPVKHDPPRTPITGRSLGFDACTLDFPPWGPRITIQNEYIQLSAIWSLSLDSFFPGGAEAPFTILSLDK